MTRMMRCCARVVKVVRDECEGALNGCEGWSRADGVTKMCWGPEKRRTVSCVWALGLPGRASPPPPAPKLRFPARKRKKKYEQAEALRAEHA